MQVLDVPHLQDLRVLMFIEKAERMVREMRRNRLAEDRRARDPQCLCPRCTLMHAYTGLSQLSLL